MALLSRRVLLFGASGNTGKWIVKTALEKEDVQLICYVRDAEKLKKVVTQAPVGYSSVSYDAKLVRENKSVEASVEEGQKPVDSLGPPLVVLTGTLLDGDSVKKAVGMLSAGDTIICVAGKPVGCKDKAPLMPEFLRILVPAMRDGGIKRLLYQGGALSAVPGGWKSPGQIFGKWIVAPMLGVSRMVADNDLVAPYLAKECSDIDWIYPRPGALKDGKAGRSAKKKIGISFFANVRILLFEDLAEWDYNAALVEHAALCHKAPYVAYSFF